MSPARSQKQQWSAVPPPMGQALGLEIRQAMASRARDACLRGAGESQDQSSADGGGRRPSDQTEAPEPGDSEDLEDINSLLCDSD